MTPTNLLTIDEVAERYRVPLATLRYWRHKGDGPKSFRLGKRVMYRLTDCEAWLEQQYAGAGRGAA